MSAEQTKEWIEKGLEDLENKVEELRAEAKEIIDGYWSFHLAQNEQKPLGARVKVTDGNMAIEWYRNQYVLKKDGGWQALSKYLRRDKGNRYSSRTFKQWARSLSDLISDSRSSPDNFCR